MLLLTAALALATTTTAGCGSGTPADTSAPVASPTLIAGRADLNPVDVSELKSGGELHWPYEGIPVTFNYHQLDGPSEDNAAVVNALMPRPFRKAADGGRQPDPDYVVSATLTAPSPQTVRYILNPNATWSDGTPITWRDFAAQWKALNGTDPAYQVAGSNGYDDIASVARGGDDKQVIVTFRKPFAEWQGLFSPLYPASNYSTPIAFNTAWVRKIPVSAGPFVLQAIDQVAHTVTLARNEKWWGPKAKLDRIVFKPYALSQYFQGLTTPGGIDFAPIGYNTTLARQIRTLRGFVLRQSVNRHYQELLFNGGPGAPLADLALRRAIARGLDRDSIAKRAIGEINEAIHATGNHIYPLGSVEYQDNSGELSFNTAVANQQLDALGWRRVGNRRQLGGKPLQLRVVIEAADPVAEQVSLAMVEQLGAIGVTAIVQPLAPKLKEQALRAGNFDLILNREETPSMPLSTEVRRYYDVIGTDIGSNYARINNGDVVDMFSQSAQNLNDEQRTADGNSLDKLIWEVVRSVPLFPSPGAYAVRSTLANFGAPGLSDIDYAQIGFTS